MMIPASSHSLSRDQCSLTEKVPHRGPSLFTLGSLELKLGIRQESETHSHLFAREDLPNAVMPFLHRHSDQAPSL
jgi:hypothetical protein